MYLQPVTLTRHPRLCLGADPATRLSTPDDGLLGRAGREVAERAEEYLSGVGMDDLPSTHNAHLIRARRMQSRVLTLITQWFRTGDSRFRDAAIRHVDRIGAWEYWSWITWRIDDPRHDAIFDLSYGENSTTLGFAYDLLYDDLDQTQRERMIEIARTRSLGPLTQILDRGQPWWFGKPDSNWNPVCAGGAGMLALSMQDVVPEAAAISERVEESIEPFLRALETTDGGFPEGIGYWNYGMRYAFLYLLSFERARGEPHRLLRSAAVRKTLAFPLDFYPHAEPCSFGDGNHWVPLPVHVAAARQLEEWPVVRSLENLVGYGELEGDYQFWPRAAETVLWAHRGMPEPPPTPEQGAQPGPQIRLYDGLGWCRIADRWPDPELYLSVRGGSTEVPHGHLDLLSFHAVVKDERLIENLVPAEYLDTTFGPRRYELLEMGPQSKNALLIDGVGITKPAQVEPRVVRQGTTAGVFLDATQAIGGGRQEESLARFLGRLVVLLDGRAALIVDRAELTHEGRVESRLHTRAAVTMDGNQARLTGKRQRMTVALAASDAFELTVASTVPTTPGDDARVLRWCGPVELGQEYWLAALLVPGHVDTSVRLESDPEGARLRVAIDGWTTELVLRTDLSVITA